jgi:16S rRNA processing protein RimM
MTQTVNNRFIEIGRIGRPRGLEGLVRFMPNDIFTAELFDQVSVFYMRNMRSDLIPARIEFFRVEEKRNRQTFFVKFDTIANRDDADVALNRSVFADREFLQKSEPAPSDENDLYGYTVVFENKDAGEVIDLISNPAHPLLEIKYGTGSLLIPLVDEFIERIDHEKRSVYCKNLDQLTDL